MNRVALPLLSILNLFQRLILFVSYSIHKKSNQSLNNDTWVIGVREVASLQNNIANALGNSITINFGGNKFYKHDYTYSYTGRTSYIQRLFIGPYLLGKLASQYSNFFYIGGQGFLFSAYGRREEFQFLKSKGAKIVCCFTGSEIRSHKLFNQYAIDNNIDVITTYQTTLDFPYLETLRKRLAHAADSYADIIINPRIDQMSYIKKECHPFIYFYPENKFYRNSKKFSNIERISILHSPSAPLIKGTPLVRAAIKKLREEGYDFDYVEITDQPNDIVLSALKESHIVLNQFYAFVPGMFGIEALAHHNAVLMSADETIESTLEKGSNTAWIPTRYWSIYENLKHLLDNPRLIKLQADKGYDWALKHYSYKAGTKKLNKLIKSFNDD